MASRSGDRFSLVSVRVAAVAVSLGVLAACSSIPVTSPEANLASAPADQKTDDARPLEPVALDAAKGGKLSELARAHAAEPGDAKAAIRYARQLKKAGRAKEAQQVLEQASAANETKPLLLERGLLALEMGQAAEAKQYLTRGAEPRTKDWRVLSGLGVAASALGQQSEAQKHFQTALQASPDNPTVLNNLAVSYILDNKVELAEATLRKAAKAGASKPRIAQNMALVAALKTPSSAPSQPVASVAPNAARSALPADAVPPAPLPPVMGLTKTDGTSPRPSETKADWVGAALNR